MPIQRISERLYPCLICAGSKSKDLTAQCSKCGAPLDIGPEMHGAKVGGYTLVSHVGRGYYGATFKAVNGIGKPFALKLVPYEIYEIHDKSFGDEIKKYRILGTHANIAELIDAGETQIELRGRSIKFYFIVMEWIEGITLSNYLKSGKTTAEDIYSIILDVGSALARFESESLVHNDLNSDNIMLKPMREDDRIVRTTGAAFTCKVVDTGSAVFKQRPDPTRLSDLVFLGHHIKDLRALALRGDSANSREDLYFLNSLERVISRMLDEDATRRIGVANEAIQEIRDLRQRSFTLNDEAKIALQDPFNYLNANDFPSDTYINYLFSALLPWISAILTPEAQGTLITGPRGCGKTMILRSMRLRTRLNRVQPSENIKAIQRRLSKESHIAFFVSARIEIGNQCALSKLPRWTEKEELVVYFFILLYAVEVLETLHYGIAKSIITIDSESELNLCKFFSSALGLGDAVTIVSALRQIKLKQEEIERDGVIDLPKNIILNSGFFTQLSVEIAKASPQLAGKNITFLLDDFSSPRVPEHIQKILLPLIWNSGGGYSFRVSAHSSSTATEDVRGNRYQDNREFREINLGREYLYFIEKSAGETSIVAYIEDVLRRRLTLADRDRSVGLTDLLGPDYEDQIAREIVRRTSEKSLHGLRYKGKNTIVKLCSGDMSYLLDMLGRMMRLSPSLPVSSELQHRVIRQYSWKTLFGLNEDSAKTCNLYEVALNFGKLSKLKLLQEKGTRRSGSHRPAEYLRIEVTLDSELENVRAAISELLQHGVFIDGGFSNASSGTVARRLLFRKIFTPAFPTTYNNRDTFAWSSARFLEFVRDPEKFVRREMSLHSDDNKSGLLWDDLATPAAD